VLAIFSRGDWPTSLSSKIRAGVWDPSILEEAMARIITDAGHDTATADLFDLLAP
jgi:hypothetical protein